MPPRATGQVIERETKDGRSYALRFPALGGRQYVTLGSDTEGWTRRRADDELLVVMARVRRGDWRPPEPDPAPDHDPDPSFHAFASEWYEGARGELRATTRADYEWQLSNHLLPFFRAHRLSQITVREVDRYRERKVREGRLSPASINKTITRLGQVMERAVEYELVPRNPVRVNPRQRKVKASRPRPVHLDSAEQIAALLDAAADLDGRATARTDGRRPLLATLVFAGLRIGEACALVWADVDLAAGRLLVGRSKTDAGVREVDMLPALRDELAAHRASEQAAGRGKLGDLAFPTAAGTPRDKDNARSKVMAPAMKRADELLAERGHRLLPAGLTPHKLRHTFASILTALGRDPAYVMAQIGHTDARFTLSVYAHAMRRGEGEKRQLQLLVGGSELATASAEVEPRGAGSPFSGTNTQNHGLR